MVQVFQKVQTNLNEEAQVPDLDDDDLEAFERYMGEEVLILKEDGCVNGRVVTQVGDKHKWPIDRGHTYAILDMR